MVQVWAIEKTEGASSEKDSEMDHRDRNYIHNSGGFFKLTRVAGCFPFVSLSWIGWNCTERFRVWLSNYCFGSENKSVD